MEELIKYVALVVVLTIVGIGMWAFITSTQAAQAAAASATSATATTAQSSDTDSGWTSVFYRYTPPATNIYVNDASGNYWRRFYSSSIY